MTETRRQPRGAATRSALMRAAEELIAEHGIEAISIRQIVSAAGQKNESALQYHFGSLNGLIDAIHRYWEAHLDERRAALVLALQQSRQPPSLRGLCAAMLQPSFDLARSKPAFRRYVRAFGYEMASAESALQRVTRKGGDSMQQLAVLLRAALPHLDDAGYRRRMDTAVRLCATSMFHQARRQAPRGNAFRGDQGLLFFHSLLDALTGLLSAPESEQTRRLAAPWTRDTG